ncbi:MAG: hypothetical protein K2X32_04775 [Phycisphaerales bacterium]|nr:hypothetical protein [Phycisphaerales bacterium]
MPADLPPGSPPAMLCESCGYDISGTAEDQVCPECGVPVASSLPERRDLAPRGRGWAEIAREVIVSPRAAMRAATIGDRRIARFGDTARVSAAIVVTIAAFAPLLGYAQSKQVMEGLLLVVGGLLLFGIIYVLTLIESIGIRFFGRQRDWRITREVSWTVCNLASIGWLVGACVSAIGCVFLHLGLMQQMQIIDSRHLPEFGLIGALVVIAGAIIGLLSFELLVYLGVRQCRFANPPGVRRYSAAGGSSGSVRIQRADSEQ